MITTISQLVSKIESDNQPSALRFEPLWKYATDALCKECIRSHPAYMNMTTARALLMFSYGKYQIMGSVLYELGYKGTLIDFQNSTTLQDVWFTEFLTQRKIRFTLAEVAESPPLRKLFTRRYNGNEVAYGEKMVKEMRANGIKVVE